MNIIGIHFGHDAAVTILRQGKIASYLLKERVNRVKHALAIDIGLIDRALRDAGLSVDEIDFIAMTSTQNYEMFVDDPSRWRFGYGRAPGDALPSSAEQFFARNGTKVESQTAHVLLGNLYNAENPSLYHRNLFPEYRQRDRAGIEAVGYLQNTISTALWDPPSGLEDIRATDFTPLKNNDAIRYGFHYPMFVVFDGRTIPGCFVQHHAAHAASAYYISGFENAAILTHDGGAFKYGHNNGMFSYGVGNRLYHITPHHLSVGDLYDKTGHWLGFDLFGAAGKLMGLAPYGHPRFFDRRFVGNSHDLDRRGFSDALNDWVRHCLTVAGQTGYDLAPARDLTQITAPINADIAASTQKLFEETILAAVDVLQTVLLRTGTPTPNLCFGGGTGLNCPTNSRLYREGPFRNLFIPPMTDDSGLSLGAALYTYHNLFDQPIPADGQPLPCPYYGSAYDTAAVQGAVAACGDTIAVTHPDDPAAAAADDLAANRIIGWFTGRSELGPRALGHRSLLADPRDADNWRRVNLVKSRETWRPFAPAVLEEEATRWFHGAPHPSPHMLFTATVTSPLIPAITHVDNSARVQTVGPENGDFHRLLQAFHHRTGVPVLLNTSFNGPGEPIVETPQDALRFLVNSTLDVLYMEGLRIVRPHEAASGV